MQTKSRVFQQRQLIFLRFHNTYLSYSIYSCFLLFFYVYYHANSRMYEYATFTLIPVFRKYTDVCSFIYAKKKKTEKKPLDGDLISAFREISLTRKPKKNARCYQRDALGYETIRLEPRNFGSEDAGLSINLSRFRSLHILHL